MRFLWLLIALVGTAGLEENFRVSTPERRRQMFIFYTNLSNLTVTVFYYCLALLPETSGLYQWLLTPLCRMGVAWLITVTICIYHFVLAPTIRQLPGKDPQHMRFYTPANLLLHYVVPVSTILEWLIFADKAGLTVGACGRVILIPLLYAAVLLLRPYIGGRIMRDNDSFYPYPFLDADRLGYPRVLRNILFSAAGLFVLVLVFWVVSHVLTLVFA